jgi:hypothetical protein
MSLARHSLFLILQLFGIFDQPPQVERMNQTTMPVYPACCPQCHELKGWPFSAGTCDRPGVIVVRLRCGNCHNEWTADVPKPAMATVGAWPGRQLLSAYRTA